MKKKRSKKPNNRPKKLKPTNAASPWRKYKTVPPKPPKTITPAPEIIVDASPDAADRLADEIEAAEADPDREPEEESE